jgi:hypothetical protein
MTIYKPCDLQLLGVLFNFFCAKRKFFFGRLGAKKVDLGWVAIFFFEMKKKWLQYSVNFLTKKFGKRFFYTSFLLCFFSLQNFVTFWTKTFGGKFFYFFVFFYLWIFYTVEFGHFLDKKFWKKKHFFYEIFFFTAKCRHFFITNHIFATDPKTVLWGDFGPS